MNSNDDDMFDDDDDDFLAQAADDAEKSFHDQDQDDDEDLLAAVEDLENSFQASIIEYSVIGRCVTINTSSSVLFPVFTGQG